MRVFIDSNSYDPYYHLALEHHFLYKDLDIDRDPVLIIYRNHDSIVLGNFQNPWLEADIKYCLENSITLARRFSGGGCVFHDLGNINFCYIGPKNDLSKKKLTDFILQFLNVYGIPAQLGEKSDILLEGQKISGSAFRETKNRTLHHCTLLFDSNLEKLKRSLSSPLRKMNIATKALPSRLAIVKNLSQYAWSSPSEIINLFIDFLQKQGNMGVMSDMPSNLNISYWSESGILWGKTPAFIIEHMGWKFTIEQAVIKKIRTNNNDELLANIALPAIISDLAPFALLSDEIINFLWRVGLLKMTVELN